MTSEKRNSGSIISYPCVLKQGHDPSIMSQAFIMERHPNIFAPILAKGLDRGLYFYTTPLMEHWAIATEFVAQTTLQRLELYWGMGVPSVSKDRLKYFEYVSKLDIPTWLLDAVKNYYEKTKSIAGRSAIHIHGDATVENTVHNGNLSGYWIDPNPRPVPKEIEVDLGKLWQSWYGYHPLNKVWEKVLEEFLASHQDTILLQMFYLLTHIARLWNYQPQKHEWAKEVTDAVVASCV
jgi:hypothetical protein